jgi:hypothetical protein
MSMAVRTVVAEREQEHSSSPSRVDTAAIPAHFHIASSRLAAPAASTGDKHEQNCQEDWAENRRALHGAGARARRDIVEAVFLCISNALHQEANRLLYATYHVAACSESWLWVFGNVWEVDYGDWQTDHPDPDHLEDPEPKEREKLVVEAVIFAGR